MPVYLIRAGDTEFIKIGWAEDPEARRRDLQTAHWCPLKIIRLINGIPATERWMHKHFIAQHVHMEWFRFIEYMLDVEPPEAVTLATPTDAGMLLLKQTDVPRLARALGLTRSAIHQWEQVPAERLPAVEAYTGIPRHILRPDICPPPDAAA